MSEDTTPDDNPQERTDEQSNPETRPEEPDVDQPGTQTDTEGPSVTRRGVLTTAGILGVLGLGAGTASADPSGQIGTSSDPLKKLYTAELNGGVTNDQSLTDFEGSGLSINSGTLDASGASSWTDGDAGDLLEPSAGGKVGVEVDKIADDGSGQVTMESTLDLKGSDLLDGGTTVWDSSNGYVPQGQLESDSLTVAGNSVSLGGSTGIAHGDLDSVSTDQHHNKDHDHSEAGISTVPTGGLSNDTITRTAGSGLTYSSGSADTSLGGSSTLGIASGGVDTTELATDAVTSGKIPTDAVTGAEIDLSSIAGQNISVDTTNDELDASVSTLWEDAGDDGLLNPSDSGDNGIGVTNVETDNLTDNGSGQVTMGSPLDLDGNNISSSSGAFSITTGSGNLTLSPSGDIDAKSNNVNNVASIDNGGSAISADDNLDLSGNNLETTTGGLTVKTNDNGNLTLNPGANNELALSNQSTTSSDDSLLAIDGSGNVKQASSTTLNDVGSGGSKWTDGNSGASWLEPSDGGDTKLEGIDTIESNDSESSLTITQDTNDNSANSYKDLTLKTVDTGNSNYPGDIVLDADPNNNDSRKISLKTGGTERATVDSSGVSVKDGDASDSVDITHGGTDGDISTTTGDLKLSPSGKVDVDGNNIEDSGTTIYDGSNIGTNVLGNALQTASSSQEGETSFSTWRQASATRPALVSYQARTQTDGSTNAIIFLDIDESGGTSSDYSYLASHIENAHPANAEHREQGMFFLPAGAQYKFNNQGDPNNFNNVSPVREFIL